MSSYSNYSEYSVYEQKYSNADTNFALAPIKERSYPLNPYIVNQYPNDTDNMNTNYLIDRPDVFRERREELFTKTDFVSNSLDNTYVPNYCWSTKNSDCDYKTQGNLLDSNIPTPNELENMKRKLDLNQTTNMMNKTKEEFSPMSSVGPTGIFLLDDMVLGLRSSWYNIKKSYLYPMIGQDIDVNDNPNPTMQDMYSLKEKLPTVGIPFGINEDDMIDHTLTVDDPNII